MGDLLPFPIARWPFALRRFWIDRLDRLDAHLTQIQAGGSDMTGLALIAPKDDPVITSAEPRVLAAPIALVWKCFSEREYIARWWGPASIGDLVVREFDFRVGGTWRFDHVLKRGPTVGFYGVYRAIEPTTRIVNTFGFSGLQPGNEAEETHLFEPHGDTTLYRSIVRFPDFSGRDGMLNSGMEKGALESMRQLDDLLAALNADPVK